jgi:hypothetical protein
MVHWRVWVLAALACSCSLRRFYPPDTGVTTDAGLDSAVTLVDAGPCMEGRTEICNGADDNCNGAPDEGFACVLGTMGACDTTCATPGMRTCINGCEWGACTGTGTEECNGIDDNCDGRVDEGFECQPGTMGMCTGTCGMGTRTCGANCMWQACGSGGGAETCNGLDDDCDGTIDSAAACPDCAYSTMGTHSYLFCSGMQLSWQAAETACVALGYHLVTVDDMPEATFLAGRADGIADNSSWWTGGHQPAIDEDWEWVRDGRDYSRANGEELGAFRFWDNDEPSDGTCPPGMTQECMEMYSYERDGDGGDPTMPPGSWNDACCGSMRRFICEAQPTTP